MNQNHYFCLVIMALTQEAVKLTNETDMLNKEVERLTVWQDNSAHII